MEGRSNQDNHLHDAYPECQHIPKAVQVIKEITEAQARALPPSKEENVLPLFERKISDYKQSRLCSLEMNEALKCRWKSYINLIEGMKRSAIQFPNHRNFHFYNGAIKYMPSLTTANRTTYRRQMGLGPGVDGLGQLPIPYDLSRPKFTAKNKTKPAKSPKVKRH